MKQLLYLWIFFSLEISVYAQQKPNKNTIDHAELSCTYLFSKKKEGESIAYRKDTLMLDLGKQFSRFYDPARLGRDSIISQKMKDMNSAGIKSINVYKASSNKDLSNMPGTVASSTAEGESYQIIKDRKSKKMRVLDYGAATGDRFVYEDDPGKWSWQMSAETDTVAGYICQKARTQFRGREYVAWFSPEIPLNDGPWKFSGLPGLILKVEDAEGLFVFELIGLKQHKFGLPIVADESKSIKCSRAEFQEQKLKQGNGIQINFNNGEVIIAENPVKYDYLPMEKE